MKNKSPKGFTQFMYWFFRISFWLQLMVVTFLLVFNYVSHNSKEGLYFTVRGNIYANEIQLQPNKDVEILDSIDNNTPTPITKISRSQYGLVTIDRIGSETNYFLNKRRVGFSRTDFTDLTSTFTIKNIAWTLCDILNMLLWLLITFQIMKILQSLKNESVFIQKNIKRISVIGWMFILIPFVQLARDQIFFLVIKQYLKIPGFTLFSNFSWNDLSPLSLYGTSGYGTMNHPLFPSIALGLIILVIVQIFKNGFELQEEKDLTI